MIAATTTARRNSEVQIAGRTIGNDEPPYFIADVGANHDGDFDRAKKLIELAAAAGADAVKFQNFAAETIVSRRGFEELGQVGHQVTWKDGVYETYQRVAMPLDWVPLLATFAEEVGITFLTTAYSKEILDAVDPYVPAHKIGSGDITWLDYLRYVGGKEKPVLLGTGASGSFDVWRALWEGVWDGNQNVPVVLLQCNSNYDGNPESLQYSNLRVLEGWARRGIATLGLSDHTPGYAAVCAAVTLGARVIEKHLTDDRSRSGPDHGFAMTPAEWAEMIEVVQPIPATLGDGVKKIEPNEATTVVVQRRAIRYRRDLEAGHVVTADDVIVTRPCPPHGLPPYEIEWVLGRALQRDVETDTLVLREDLR